jgi:hypothetical protein
METIIVVITYEIYLRAKELGITQIPSLSCPIALALGEAVGSPVRAIESGVSLIETPSDVYPLSQSALEFMHLFDRNKNSMSEMDFPVYLRLPRIK